ncbi:hypothetical protein OH77DRAFT_124018 [Trametes cingulata]|nr:hypothetical protein OH77DRAFT_124018 [Trametes cingulata]
MATHCISRHDCSTRRPSYLAIEAFLRCSPTSHTSRALLTPQVSISRLVQHSFLAIAYVHNVQLLLALQPPTSIALHALFARRCGVSTAQYASATSSPRQHPPINPNPSFRTLRSRAMQRPPPFPRSGPAWFASALPADVVGASHRLLLPSLRLAALAQRSAGRPRVSHLSGLQFRR